jgi:thiol-disulfide isomerase/thioredoxin
MTRVAHLLPVVAALIAGQAAAQTYDSQMTLARFAAKRQAPAADPARPLLLSGKAAPRFLIEQWFNAKAQPETAGRIVLIDFWSVNCAPCVASMPKLAAAAHRFSGQPLTVITIHPDVVGVREPGIAGNVVWASRPADRVLPDFLSTKGVGVPVGLDVRQAIARFESHDLPADEAIAALLRRPE